MSFNAISTSMYLAKGGAEKVAEVLADAMKHQADKAAEVLTVATNGLVRANDNLASLQDRLIQTLRNFSKEKA